MPTYNKINVASGVDVIDGILFGLQQTHNANYTSVLAGPSYNKSTLIVGTDGIDGVYSTLGLYLDVNFISEVSPADRILYGVSSGSSVVSGTINCLLSLLGASTGQATVLGWVAIITQLTGQSIGTSEVYGELLRLADSHIHYEMTDKRSYTW